MLSLPALFSDHAVFQHGKPIPIWGQTLPDTRVEVRLNGVSALCEVSPEGFFQLRLPPQPVGGPYVMEVENRISSEVFRISDVMIGEVWLASGQSNMEFTVNRNRPRMEIGSPLVRMLTVPFVHVPGGHVPIKAAWSVASDPERFGQFSAVAYFFAEKLAAELDCTVGILCSSVGGSDALSWVSREGMSADPYFMAIVRDYEALLYTQAGIQMTGPAFSGGEKTWLQNYFRRHPLPVSEPRPSWVAADFDDSSWETAALPDVWKHFDEDVNGIYRFRREVEIPEAWNGRRLMLSLGAVDKHDITWFNGCEIGRTGRGLNEKFWNVERRYEIPAHAVQKGKGVIAVRACSFLNDGGLIGPAEVMFLTDGVTRIDLCGNWKYQREVNLGKIVPPPANDADGEPCAIETHADPLYFPPLDVPYLLFDNMIAPLIPYAMRGVIWFQGEHNTSHRPERYEQLMIALIQDWRRRWGEPAMPFHQVELAGFGRPRAYQSDSAWTPLRIQQRRAAQNTGSSMVPAYDIGDADDIHFPGKQPVGERLALTALAEDYGVPLEDVPGPVLLRSEIGGREIILTFAHAGELRADAGETLFQICGRDGIFHPAKFRLQNNRVFLSGAVWNSPLRIRYAWADNPAGAVIRNRAGLPLPPFEIEL